jgi:hypothetical protein
VLIEDSWGGTMVKDMGGFIAFLFLLLLDGRVTPLFYYHLSQIGFFVDLQSIRTLSFFMPIVLPYLPTESKMLTMSARLSSFKST